MQDLSPTARVILGVLGLGPRTGYDVKKLTDISTRFFWSASYGQIYPELRRLAGKGLVAADEPLGGRRRRVYRLTDAGQEALREWLTGEGWGDFEYRDEGLLKLFFGDLLSREEALGVVRRQCEKHEATLGHFRGIAAELEEERQQDPAVFPYLALDYGLAFMEWVVGWWRALERELTPAAGRARGPSRAERFRAPSP